MKKSPTNWTRGKPNDDSPLLIRAQHAHMNCVENLPVYAAIVVALMATGLQSPMIDRLAVIMLAARVVQTLVHILLPPTNAATGVRFTFYFVQVMCMVAITIIVAMTLLVRHKD